LDIIFTGLLLCLLVLFFQDWKYRSIHMVLPILIFLSSYYIIRQENKLSNKIMILNLCFFLITLSILILYMSLKNKRFLNPFQNYFGLGDLLFYISVTPLFNLKNYILFFILSMIFAICLQFTLRKKMKHKTVPLAGFSALFLFIILAMDGLLSIPKISLL